MLCFATRPLKVRELIDAVAVEIKEPMGFQKDRRMQDYNDIHDICPGFIELNAHVDEADDFEIFEATDLSLTDDVQIAHFSVQEYLVSDRIRGQKAAVFSLDSAAANAEIAQVCLVYLLDHDLSTFLCDKCKPDRKIKFHNRDEKSLRDGGKSERKDFALNDLLENYPLTKFAAESWHQQYQNMTAYNSEVQCLVSRLFLQNGTNINWLSLHDEGTYYPGPLRYIAEFFEEAASPVYYASLLGLYDTLHEWFDGRHMRNEEDQVMVLYSMPKLLKLISTKGGYYDYPLVAASAFGCPKAIQLLLDKGANIDTCGTHGTALMAASGM